MNESFKEFTGSYPLSKTLRFALIPQGETLSNMAKNGIFRHDEQRSRDYQTIKPLFDKVHELFITESLSIAEIDWQDFAVFYQCYKSKIKDASLSEKDKSTLKEELQSRLKKLREEIANLYAITAEARKKRYLNNKWKEIFKEKGYKILTESNILELLTRILSTEMELNEEQKQAISNFKGFFTYFTGFNQNRENYYSKEEKSTAVAYRIVNENLIKFCDNAFFKEKLSVLNLTDEEKKIFDINFYNHCLTQKGIEAYNTLIADINSKINRRRQENKIKIQILKPLYKQIGSQIDKKIPFMVIENTGQLQETLKEMMEGCDSFLPEIKRIIKQIFENEEEYGKIRISKRQLSRLSNRYFKNWYAINEKGWELGIFKKNKGKDTEEEFKIPEYISLADLKKIIDVIDDEEGVNWWKFIEEVNKDIETYDQSYQQEKLSVKSYLEHTDKPNKEQKDSIKKLGDKAIFLFKFLKVFKVSVDKIDGDLSELYNKIDSIITEFSINKQYDAIRNYLTKKPFSEDKMKLNFDCSTLLWGRDINKEKDNLSIILRKEGKFYLAIMNKDFNNLFKPEKHPSLYENTDGREKMNYKLLPWPNKMLPKVFFCKKGKGIFKPSNEILEIYNKWTFKKGKNFDIVSLHKLIDFYKYALQSHKERDQAFKFQFKSTQEYEDISKFYAEVEQQGYKLDRTPINSTALNNFVQNGKCYLFEISCKDFEKQDITSRDNLQSIYRKALFQQKSNIKLNGEAEIFFREASLKAEDVITKKNNVNLTKANQKAIKNWRYTKDRFLFHCPITLHFGTKTEGKFNQRVNQYIAKNFDKMHVIGIDRGEKHLNFYSVINMKGEIVEQGTLNIINNTNYRELLNAKEKNRKDARENRDTIENIKNLKDGYISQVVHQLANLILKYNAVIVLEDLNGGFKIRRQKIEKAAYQKLELDLAKKLNYLVLKEAKNEEPGSATNAYQLCPLVNNYGDIKGKQRGIMFYTRANYTSITDPASGRRKNLYLKEGKKGEEMRAQILNFTSIGYDEQKSAFYFTYNPKKFSGGKGLKKERTLRSNVERWRGKPNDKWIRESKKEDITDQLTTLCRENNLEINRDILSQIKEKTELQAKFYSKMIWLIKLIMQIRNSDDQWNDFILSPVEFNGEKFDSRKYFSQTNHELPNTISKPTSWDANGAFNIARKGLMMMERIKKWKDSGKIKLFISDEERDEYLDKIATH